MMPQVISTELKFAAGLALAALLVFAGWQVEAWRSSKASAKREQAIAEAEARGAKANLALVVAANERADTLAASLAATEINLEKLNQEKADAVRSLTAGRRCLDSAAVRVLNERLPAHINGGAVSEAAGKFVSTDAAFATDTDVGLWIGQCQRGYETCRGRLAAIADFYKEAGGE